MSALVSVTEAESSVTGASASVASGVVPGIATLSLRLSGPLQAWGDSTSRTESRFTGPVPTLSGVLGIAGAALGRPRGANNTDLLALDFAVHIDRPGVPIKEYQTKEKFPLRLDRRIVKGAPGGPLRLQRDQMSKTLPTTAGDFGEAAILHKTYLSNAAFTAALTGDRVLLEEIQEALLRPVFPLYLGRKSCPPGELVRFVDGLSDDVDPVVALERRWRAAPSSTEFVAHRTALVGEAFSHRLQDVPLDTDMGWRKFLSRNVTVVRKSL